jgi:hypothetical protein
VGRKKVEDGTLAATRRWEERRGMGGGKTDAGEG